jgi:hypothetical protein
MKKFFVALPFKATKQYDTYELAEEAAKKTVGNKDCFNSYGTGDVYILEAIAVAKQPIPDVEVTKL